MNNGKQTKGVRGTGALNKFQALVGGLSITLFMLVVGNLVSDCAWVSEAFGNTLARGKIVVANRASGTISIIDTHSDGLVDTIPLPSGPNVPEPMYVVYVPSHNRVFVDDRMNNRVVVFDAHDFSVDATIDTGAGPFHMWGDRTERQLWVNNDIDKTITVVDTNTLEVVTTIPIPADLVAEGGIPHDVILDPTDRTAFVTILGIVTGPDVVVKFSTETFEEIDRAEVGQDPHLSLARQNNLLYVPCQGTSELFVLNRDTLDIVTVLTILGAHGAGMARNGKRFYTTNLPGGGIDGLFAIDTDTNTIIGVTDTPFAVPHNIALTPNSKKLYVTHSGATSNKVTIYTVSNRNPVPVLSGEVTVGFNPFGLAYVP